MKKILYAFFALAGCVLLTQCKSSDFLSVSSPANTDDTFVTSTVSETFKTLTWCYGTYRGVAGGGNYNWNDPCTDAEYYPEYNSGNGRCGYLRPKETTVNNGSSQFNSLYSILARCSRIANILKQKEEYTSAIAAGKTNDWTQLYGEAMTFYCYCYYELIRHFGDVPYGLENTVVNNGYSLASRVDVYDKLIAILKEVEPNMYDLGSGGITAERMSRTFANLLIGEIDLNAGGYQTIRTDVAGLYGDVKFDTKYTGEGYSYARRTDWQKYYQDAQTYLRRTLNERKGSLKFLTVDDRSYANNPYQRSLQYVMDMAVSPESIFEVGNLAPNQSERPYSQGRPSDGGNSNGAPCKVFGGIRVIPSFYYEGFEDGDKRWDASAVVTGSDGKGNEKLVSLTSGSKTKGGIAINKWDINKMASPYTVKPRNSGMNYLMRRISNAMLLLAEADAQLGENTEALSLLNQIRDRAFGDAAHRLIGLSGDTLIEAVSMEVKREFLGEGDIKLNELRNGTFTTKAHAVRTELKTVIAGLEANGYYTFPNGRTISNYIYTKSIARDNPLTYDAVAGDPVLSPGWRGVYDYTKIAAVASVVSGTKHNLAIMGLFNYIDPDSIEGKALVAAGYSKVPWGIEMVNQKDQLYDYNILSGIDLTDVPLHYHPLPLETLQQSKGQITNGYGLPQE